MTDSEHMILLGYGDVGKRIVDSLKDINVSFVVVDRNIKMFENADFKSITGNAADEEILKEAGVKDASTVIITLNNDTDVIFATLITRGLNPNSTILARANSIKSIDKIYKAGADYVASLSIVAGQMLARMTSMCPTGMCEGADVDIMLYEGIEIEKHLVKDGSKMAGRSVRDLGLTGYTGCRLIGIMRGEEVISEIYPPTVVEAGDIVAVVGNKEKINDFKRKYADRISNNSF